MGDDVHEDSAGAAPVATATGAATAEATAGAGRAGKQRVTGLAATGTDGTAAGELQEKGLVSVATRARSEEAG